MSSAKSKSSSVVNVPHLMPRVMSDVVCRMTFSMAMMKSVDDITNP